MVPAEFAPRLYAAMNSRRVIARTGEWTDGLTTVFCRVKSRSSCRRSPEAAPCRWGSQDAAAGEKPRRTAMDLVRKVHQEKKTLQATEAPVSGQQRRVMELKRFSLQLQNVHPNVLAKHLHRSVLYQDKRVVVINKPYGVPVRDDSRATSISSVLPVLSKMMDGMKVRSDSQMLPCLGLEKEATGVLCWPEVKRQWSTYSTCTEITKVVTVGVPVPSEGVVDIPIIEREVTGPQPHYKMALSPLFRMNDEGDGVTKVRANRQAHPAVTKYRVLDSSSGCSLVELQPLTGVKHQMRVHMALALACPILGDHKYSHWSKLAPQKLPERVLGKLGLEQSKIRYLPLHLHAHQLILTGLAPQEDMDVSCPLPKYFTQTLKHLHLNLTDK
ncbi:hypothetical protein INR49_029598 [Caranx melampygus]|nr:hypothetical protein INR49_029598 [Caranx melampygus]